MFRVKTTARQIDQPTPMKTRILNTNSKSKPSPKGTRSSVVLCSSCFSWVALPVLLSASMNSKTNLPSPLKSQSRLTSLEQGRLLRFTVGLTMTHIHFPPPSNILGRLSASARDLSTEGFKIVLIRSQIQKAKDKKSVKRILILLFFRSLDNLVTQNEHLHSRPLPILTTTFIPPPIVTPPSTAVSRQTSIASTAQSSLASPDDSPHEALNLSINNRSTPTTSSKEPASHQKVAQRDSWPPDPYQSAQYKDSKDYRSRRDSAVTSLLV